MAKLNPQQWNDWWKSNQMTSLPGLGEQAYDAEIREFWERQLAPLARREYSQVLDLACGNGGLTWLANELLNTRTARARITGVDFANINPFKRLNRKKARYPQVHFVGNTPIESLPFEDHAFDMAISQWGLEYSDLEQTIPEVCRVLKPRGAVAFICHHRESAIVKSSQTTLRGYRALLGDGELYRCMLELDQRYNECGSMAAAQGDAVCGRLVGRLNRLLYETRQALHESRSPFNGQEYLAEVLATYAPAANMKNPKRKAVTEASRDRLLQSTARYEDLWEAALDPERLARMCEMLAQAGFGDVQCEHIHYRDTGDVGLAITAARP